ncbi:hypothetical protein I5907_06285 [Panacibacter sp. DH6]|uniref:Uncharacterized protein n=1 Tax=Panacibacter microcysteis TaxID=2793269 RepID=A0A931GUX9_9BACT|nr:hypothetical protein [Panacibacter microcysteis]MBG9375835.1 hypothetical protein [Panacibacter microcysteis]
MMAQGDQEFTPQQSLQLIESIINRAKDNFAERGFMYLVWGWAVFILSLVQFVLLHFYQYPKHYMVWMCSWLVLAYHVLYMRKKARTQTVRTYTDYIISYVWITFIIMLFLLGFLLGRLLGGDYFYHINPILLALYGMPVFLTGIIMRFTPLIVGAVSCWVLSVVTTFIEIYDYQFLMLPVAMLVAWIIPGYLLKAKYNKQNA